MPHNLEIYRKRSGTSDHGKEFEYLMCAFYTLKLIDCKDVSDFEMFTNHAACGDFDDIAIKAKFIDGTLKLFLLQLKHSENAKNLYSRELEAQKGNFSLYKYQQCYQNINLDDFKKDFEENDFDVYFILYTNKHAAFEEDDKLNLQTECQIKESKNDLYQNILNTSEDENCVFTIKICEPNSCDELRSFLKNFYIYTSQKNYQFIKKILGELLNKQLSFNFDEEKFISFFKQWWEGKFVLTKPDVIVKLSELVFSPWIKTLSDQKYDTRSKLLKEAIMIFDITVVGDVDGDIVETIWDHPICDEKSIKMVTQKFGLTDRHVDKLTVENKIFWYMDKAPFVIKVNESNKKEIQSGIFLLQQHNIKKKLVLKGDCEEIDVPDDWEIFENLFCLKEKEEQLYQKIIKEFGISFQGNGMVSIENLIGSDEENAKSLGMKELFLILNKDEDAYCIEEKKEELPSEYIPRMVSAIILDANNILQQSFLKKNLLIINCDHKYSLIEDIIGQRNIEMMGISKFLQLIESKPINERTIITASNKECTMNNFQIICSKIERNVHLIKIINKQCFLLLLSHGNQEELKLCSRESAQIDEANIHNVLDCPINFLCAEPGMGKSTTLKYLKNTTPTDFWGVFIELKAQNLFFKNKPSLETILNKFLDIETKETDTFPYKIKQILLRMKKIVFFFDGLDEMEYDCIDYVIDSIRKITLQGFHVWISSRENLKEKIEKSLNLFSVGIVELNQTQQEAYISTRLEKNNYTNEEIKKIVEKISNNANIANNNKILGIPLQLYIITQILIDNKYCHYEINDKMFVLTNLYKMFFEGNIKHFLKKNGLESEKMAKRMAFELDKYTIPALEACLQKEHFELLNLDDNQISKTRDFLDFIKENCDEYGIIKDINKEGKATFHHQTYVEYFACIFLSTNFEKTRLLKNQLLANIYPNLRLLLDLELSTESPLHLGIIYRDIGPMKQYTENFQIIYDKGNRTPLHLICCYSTRYPELQQFQDYYSETNSFVKKEESRLQGMITKLVGLCPIMEKDKLFQCSAFEYASISKCLFPIEAMLEKQQDILDLVQNFDEATMLYYATKFGYYNLFSSILLQKNCLEKRRYTWRRLSILHVAVEAENYQIIEKLLLSNDTGINAEDIDGKTALYYAAENANKNLVELLIQKGANPTCISNNGLTLLHGASIRGNSDLVEYLLTHNIDPKIKNSDGKTALYFALYYKNEDVVKVLLDKGADVNETTNDGSTVLHSAAFGGDCELVAYLLRHNIDPNIKNIYGETALFGAAENGYKDVIKLLIEKNADVNCISNEGFTVLHRASVRGDYELVEYLLDHGVDPNINNHNGETALYLAVANGNKEVVNLLIQKGANPDCITNRGETLLHGASTKGNYYLIRYLLDQKIDLNIKNIYGKTPLYCVAENGNLDVLKLLIQKGADLNCTTEDERTILHGACIKGNSEVIEHLLNQNIDPNIKDKFGETALYCAAENQHTEIVKLLIQKGADINCYRNDGSSILHRAVALNDHELMELLFDYNINPNMKNINGETPLYVAAENGDYNIVKFLIEKGADCNSTIKDRNTILHGASIRGNCDLIEYLLHHNLDPNLKNINGETALYLAFYHGNKNVGELLIQKGADINGLTNDGKTILHGASIGGHCDLVQYLINQNFDPNLEDNNGETALYCAAENGNKKIVEILIGSSDPNSTTKKGRSALYGACISGNYELVEFLLEHNSDPNLADNHGKTPIFRAVKNGDKEIVKLLIQRGAKVDVISKNRSTVLHCVTFRGDSELCELLLHYNIDLDLRNLVGYCALFFAIEYRNEEVVNLLLRNGADINSVTNDGWTVLHRACYTCNFEFVDYLLKRNIAVNLKNKRGQTALYLAINHGNLHLLKQLIHYGAHIDCLTNGGRSLLHKASIVGDCDLVEYLLDLNLDPNLEDIHGKTSLYLAAEYGNKDVVNLLIQKGAHVNHFTKDGSTLLHGASIGIDCELFTEFLLNQNIDLDQKNAKGESAVHLAVINRNKNVVKYLIQKGCDVDCITKDGSTLLHVASKIGDCEYLLNYNINLNRKNNKGETALHLAVVNGNFDAVKLLIQKGANVKCVTDDGSTLLHGASAQGNIHIVKYLLNQNVDVNLKNRKEQTALCLAVINGNKNVVNLLIQKGADVKIVTKISNLLNCGLIQRAEKEK